MLRPLKVKIMSEGNSRVNSFSEVENLGDVFEIS